jgi:membrane-bound serine protease (ClpP class)
LNLLPIQHTSVLLLFAALALMVLEAKFASHGILAAAGVVCLVFGLATLVNGPVPEMRVHYGVAAGAGIGFGVITFALAWIAVRARRAKRLTGADAMLGQIAVAMTPLAPTGQVEVRGEIWKARLASGAEPVPAGTEVRVEAVDGLTLTVGR